MAKRRGRPSRPLALYREVAGQLRKRIVSGAWPHGKPAPPMLAVAREFGQGRRVVRLAYQALVQERLLVVTPSNQYRVNARVGGPTLAAGLILQVIGKNLQHYLGGASLDIQNGILTGLAKLKLPFVLLHDDALAECLPHDLLDLPVKGILLAGHFKPEVLEQYEKLGVPAVLVDAPPLRPGLHAVSFDNEAAILQAVEHLLALGHRHMAFVQFALSRLGQIDADSLERAKAFRTALKAHGLPMHEHAVVTTLAMSNPNSIEIKKLLDARPRITAVIATDGGRAKIVSKAASQAGLQIPRDLSIVSFRGLRPEGASLDFTGPALDFFKLGVRAAELISSPAGPARCDRMPVEWIQGGTTAPAKKQ